MKSKKGRVAIEILVILIVLVLLSAGMLYLVKSGIVKIGDSKSSEPILNTEFIPVSRDGFFVLKDFKFCGQVNDQFECIGQGNDFTQFEEVHFTFKVETSTVAGNIAIVENYKIKDPSGRVILDIDETKNFDYTRSSPKKTETINFKDYFTLEEELPVGEYTFELHLKNPLLNKNSKITRTFTIENTPYEGGLQEEVSQ